MWIKRARVVVFFFLLLLQIKPCLFLHATHDMYIISHYTRDFVWNLLLSHTNNLNPMLHESFIMSKINTVECVITIVQTFKIPTENFRITERILVKTITNEHKILYSKKCWQMLLKQSVFSSYFSLSTFQKYSCQTDKFASSLSFC